MFNAEIRIIFANNEIKRNYKETLFIQTIQYTCLFAFTHNIMVKVFA